MRWSKRSAAVLVAFANGVGQSLFGQYVELTTRLELLDWAPQQPARMMTARCLLGTNSWAIEGQFTQNSSNTWWFSGSNLVERTVINRLIPEPDLSRPTTSGFLAVGVPPVGQRFTQIYESVDGNPGRPVRVGDLMTPAARVCWLPFCSALALNNSHY